MPVLMDTNWFVIYYSLDFFKLKGKLREHNGCGKGSWKQVSERTEMTLQIKGCPVRKEALRRKAYPFSVVAGITATIKMTIIFTNCIVFYTLWSQTLSHLHLTQCKANCLVFSRGWVGGGSINLINCNLLQILPQKLYIFIIKILNGTKG